MSSMLGTNVRGIRKGLGLSVPKSATVLSVHPGTVFCWEAASDRPVPIEGIPWNVLTAFRQRLLDAGIEQEQIRAKGREVSDALVVGSVPVALGLLIAFAGGQEE